MAHEPRKRGPKADRLTIPGDWESAVGKALGKKRPARGWPKSKAKKPAKPKGR